MVKAIIFLYEPDLSSLPSLSVPGSVATTWITWLADQEKYIGYFLLAGLSLSHHRPEESDCGAGQTYLTHTFDHFYLHCTIRQAHLRSDQWWSSNSDQLDTAHQ